ncbi:MAG TPA: hypothetical protein VNQ76_16545 [Planctomicrobium sp.]|nr:hypothetical protein [Planctomicrobium sp.]
MKARFWIFVFAPCVIAGAVHAYAQSSPPVVIGSTGKPYGPTQAEWQYRQQYGRPSPGSQGNSGLQYVNGFPGGGGFGGHGHPGWSGWGPQLFMGFDPFTAYPPQGYIFYPSTATYNNGYHYNLNNGVPGFGTPPNPLFPNITPPVLQPLPTNDPLANGFGNSSATINSNKNPFPTMAPATPVITPSSPKAVENSYQYQTQGDIQFEMLNYYAAGERYRKSIDAAKDRADPRCRLAITLAARGRFLEAVDQLKLATAIDPTFPQTAASLDELFGASNTLEKVRVKDRVAEWTLQDPRDPNRLFLSGVFLYLDGDPHAQMVLETAALIAGEQRHLTSFLAPRNIPIPQPAMVDPAKGVPAPPQPHAPAGHGQAIPSGPEIPAIPPAPDSDEPLQFPSDTPPETGPTLPPLKSP